MFIMRRVMPLIVIAVIIAAAAAAIGQTSPSQCKQEKDQLVSACQMVVFGQNPSADCCQHVRAAHVECVCPYVTPKLANFINIERTIKQIQACGRTVPHHFKCGSVTGNLFFCRYHYAMREYIRSEIY